MNTKTLLPLTATALFALCATAMFQSTQSYADDQVASPVSAVANAPAPTQMRIVDLPTVTVRPDPAYQAMKIVTLPTLTVHPEPWVQASRIVDLPAVIVHPSPENLRAAALPSVLHAQPLAAR